MKSIYLTATLIFISSNVFSQTSNDCGWEVTNTANNAVIAIQQANFENYSFLTEEYSMSQFDCPASIGVFYTDDFGYLVCGGSTDWDNTQSMAIAAWGDDPTTPEKDGFATDEPYIFKLCVDGLGELEQWSLEMSTDAPFTDCYATNGFGSIDAITFEVDPLDFLEWAESQNCDGMIDLQENDTVKKLVKTVDIYGRDVMSTNQTGILIHIYSDLTTSKVYQF